jgi:ATP-dependent Clp protease adapter protein ClpS
MVRSVPLMSAAQTITRRLPELDDSPIAERTGEFIVIVFNNDYNTYDQVIRILQKATGCSLEEAEMETWEIDNTGRSVVHHGDRAECERAASIIATIGIKVAVESV